jgi:hypothetical protein
MQRKAVAQVTYPGMKLEIFLLKKPKEHRKGDNDAEAARPQEGDASAPGSME